MEIHLKTIGCLLILLALIHFYFPKYFNWKRDFQSVSLINRQMFYVHSFFIALVLFLMGLLCLTSTEELLGTALGRRLCLSFAVFWLARLLIQFFGYSAILWRGKKFETSVHILFTVFWTYLSSVFAFIYMNEGAG